MNNIRQSHKFTVAIEGNIGSGKSTLLNYFSKHENHVICKQEPVEEWTNIKGVDALNRLYLEPQRWAFTFNMLAMASRLKSVQATDNSLEKMRLVHDKGPLAILLERSIASSRNVFVKNSYLTKEMDDLEVGIITRWYDYLESTDQGTVDLFVYLQTSPEICLSRIQKRARPAENSLDLPFLQRLHDCHDDWLLKKIVFEGKSAMTTPVIVLDADKNLEEMVGVYRNYKEQIMGRQR